MVVARVGDPAPEDGGPVALLDVEGEVIRQQAALDLDAEDRFLRREPEFVGPAQLVGVDAVRGGEQER
jgi:hypothetical protein